MTALFRASAKPDSRFHAFEATRAPAEKNGETGKMFPRASSAILDGLRQQGRDGKAADMRETLIRHAVEK